MNLKNIFKTQKEVPDGTELIKTQKEVPDGTELIRNLLKLNEMGHSPSITMFNETERYSVFIHNLPEEKHNCKNIQQYNIKDLNKKLVEIINELEEMD